VDLWRDRPRGPCRVQFGTADLQTLGWGKASPAAEPLRLGRPLPAGTPRNAPETESGRRACSVPPRAAAPTGPPLTGAFRRRRPLDGASRLACVQAPCSLHLAGRSGLRRTPVDSLAVRCQRPRLKRDYLRTTWISFYPRKLAYDRSQGPALPK
jgi:hypothetical protein